MGITYVYFDSYYGAQSDDLKFEAGAFGTTNYITKIEFGENVPYMDFMSVFDGGKLAQVVVDPANGSYYSESLDDGAYTVVYDKEMSKILYYPLGREGSYEVLDSVTQIGSDVFADRTGLTSITIGKNVNTIGDYAFDGCTSLTAIIVDVDNTNYGNAVDENGNHDGVLYKKDTAGNHVELVYCPIKLAATALTVADTVVKVKDYAFEDNGTLTSVTFTTTSAFELGTYAFSGASVVSVALPETMTTIPDYAFSKCTSLTTVNIPGSVTVIGEYAFRGCSKIQGDLTDGSIELPEGLVEVKKYAFYQCYSLAVTIPSTVETIGSWSFRECWYTLDEAVEIVFAESESGEEKSLEIGSWAFAEAFYASAVEIPARVTKIGNGAFADFGTGAFDGLGNLVFNPSVTFAEDCQITLLDADVFCDSMITEIEIPASVTEIGGNAFESCYFLESVTFGTDTETSQLSKIGMGAFEATNLQSVVIPASVTEIGEYAFYGVQFESIVTNSLASVTFEEGNEGSNLKTIGSYAFYNEIITTLEIPASVESIGSYAFNLCAELETVTFKEDSTGKSALTEIGNGCFSGCTSLKNVTLANGLIETGDGTANGIFKGCTSLETITIPASVETISADTFDGCTALETVIFEQNCALKLIDDEAFKGCTSLTTAYTQGSSDAVTGEFVFPESTASDLSLGLRIFSGSGVTSITLSSNMTDFASALIDSSVASISLGNNQNFKTDDSGDIIWKTDGTFAYVLGTLSGAVTGLEEITSIGSYAFAGQTEITSVTIPSSVTSVGNYAFYGCTSLETVVFEGSMQDSGLGTHIFEGCSSLASVTLPTGITKIPDYCFSGCDLSQTTFPTGIVTIGSYAFQNAGLKTLNLSNVTTIDGYAFTGSSLVSVTLGENVSSLGTYAFYNCTSLVEVVWDGTFATLSGSTFRGCTSLEYVTIPSTVTSFGTYVFYNCSSLKSVDLPKGITSLGNYSFQGCSSLTDVILPDSVTSLGNYCFCECSSLANITFDDKLETIGNYAFSKCYSLESVILGKNVRYSSSYPMTYTFQYCTSLVYVYTGDTLTRIGSGTFRYCSALEEVECGPAMSIIGANAFLECYALKTVTLGKAVDTIDTSAFQSCTSLESMVIPSSVTTIGNYAFRYCTCDIYIDNTKSYADANYTGTSWYGDATVYYFSQAEPGFNATGTGYAGDVGYWHYGDNGEMVPWSFDYVTYTMETGGYVLYNAETGDIAYVCIVTGDVSEVYAVTECTGSNGSYTVTLENADSYTVVLDDATYTAIITATA